MMDFVSWDDEIPNIWKNKTCPKPPTSLSKYINDMYGGFDFETRSFDVMEM